MILELPSFHPGKQVGLLLVLSQLKEAQLHQGLDQGIRGVCRLQLECPVVKFLEHCLQDQDSQRQGALLLGSLMVLVIRSLRMDPASSRPGRGLGTLVSVQSAAETVGGPAQPQRTMRPGIRTEQVGQKTEEDREGQSSHKGLDTEKVQVQVLVAGGHFKGLVLQEVADRGGHLQEDDHVRKWGPAPALVIGRD